MFLHKSLSILEDCDHFGFILQSLHILVTVCVTPLQNLDELFIETLNGSEEASTDLVRCLVKHLLLLKDGLTSCHGVTLFFQHLQEVFNSLHAFLPAVRLHGVRELGVVVEKGGNDSKLDLDVDAGPQIVLPSNLGQLVKQLNLLLPVGLLLPPSGHNLVQLLDHELNGDLGVSGEHGNLAHLRHLGPALSLVTAGVTIFVLCVVSCLLLSYLFLLSNLPLFILSILLLLAYLLLLALAPRPSLVIAVVVVILLLIFIP